MPHPFLRMRSHILRSDFSAFIAKSFETINPTTPFVSNWHIDAIAEHLEATRRSDITRLIINMPPRALKSVCVSVAWPAWLLGQDASMRIMAASYSQQLSLRHALDTRLILGAHWYRTCFPHTRIMPGENEKHKLVTTARGFRFATSVGGTATGEGGDILIIDDPQSPLQAASATAREHTAEWFDQTFSTRLNDKKTGRIVLVMQRLHAEDLSAHLLSRGGWEHLCLPAIAERATLHSVGGWHYARKAGELLHPLREDAALLEQAKIALGSYGFAAQYQQSPILQQGGMIERAWLHTGQPTGNGAEYRCVHSWDTAIKAASHHDASACMVMAEQDGRHYLLDALNVRLEYPDLKRAIITQAERHPPEVILIEDKASGQSLLQELRRDTHLPLLGCMPKQDKITRLAAISPMLEAGALYLPHVAHWKEEFLQQLLAFPQGAHDDMVDALSQYFHWHRTHSQRLGRMRRL